MSTFAPNTPLANSKLLRALAATFHNDAPAEAPPFLSYAAAHNTFASLSSTDVDPIFKTLRTVLTLRTPAPKTTSQVLRTIATLFQSAPPPTVHLHASPTAQALLTLLKRPLTPRLHAQALAALSAIFNTPSPPPGLQQHAAPAVTHATRLLVAPTSSPAQLLSALALLHAILYATPRQLRPVLARLEPTLHALLLEHTATPVRVAAAALYASLPAAYPPKTRQLALTARLTAACAELDAIADLLDLYAPTTSGATKQCDTKYSGLLGVVQAWRYEAACELLRRTLVQSWESPVRVAVPTVLRTLCRGLSARLVDAYGAPGAVLQPEEALQLAARTASIAMQTLAVVARSLSHDALLPHAVALADVFRVRMELLVLQAREKGGDVAGASDREMVYHVLLALVKSLGSTFINPVVGLYATLLRFEFDLVMRSRNAIAAQATEKPSTVTDGGPTRKRRRRSSRGGVGDTSVVPAHNVVDLLSPATGCAVEKALQVGVSVATAVFANRGLLSKAAEEALQDLETILIDLIQSNVLLDSVLSAGKEAALGGGAGRLRAEASPLFVRCMLIGRDIWLRPGAHDSATGMAGQLKSACETLVHPRGPPLLKILHRGTAENGLDDLSTAQVAEASADALDAVNGATVLVTETVSPAENDKSMTKKVQDQRDHKYITPAPLKNSILKRKITGDEEQKKTGRDGKEKGRQLQKPEKVHDVAAAKAIDRSSLKPPSVQERSAREKQSVPNEEIWQVQKGKDVDNSMPTSPAGEPSGVADLTVSLHQMEPQINVAKDETVQRDELAVTAVGEERAPGDKDSSQGSDEDEDTQKLIASIRMEQSDEDA